jgi:hypothetical protein
MMQREVWIYMYQQKNQDSKYKKPTNCIICSKNQHRKHAQVLNQHSQYAYTCLQGPPQ